MTKIYSLRDIDAESNSDAFSPKPTSLEKPEPENNEPGSVPRTETLACHRAILQLSQEMGLVEPKMCQHCNL